MEGINGQDKWDINRINKYVQITCTYVEMCITHKHRHAPLSPPPLLILVYLFYL